MATTFKFVFRVSSSTGGLREYRNNAGKSVSAADLSRIAKEFFDGLPHQIERSISAVKEQPVKRNRAKRRS